MKIRQCAATFRKHAYAAADVADKVSLAGIAVTWVFKMEGGSQFRFPKGLLPPLVLCVLSLGCSFSKHVVMAAQYGSLWWSNRASELEFAAPSWFDWPMNALLFLQWILVVVAYVLLVLFLLGHFR